MYIYMCIYMYNSNKLYAFIYITYIYKYNVCDTCKHRERKVRVKQNQLIRYFFFGHVMRKRS